MAELVLALGTSHSPALNTPAADYLQHAQRDFVFAHHRDKAGRPTSYEALLAAAEPRLADEIAPAVLERKAAACNRAIAHLAAVLAAASLDAVIVIGDDQREQYHDDNMPALLVYWGETIRNGANPLADTVPRYWREARQQYYEAERPRDYPVATELGRHLIESLIDSEFEVSHARELRRERGEGHAFGFVHRRLMQGMAAPVPILPVVLNTYYPPNQPRPRRCVALGRAIRRAVASWPARQRVGIVASGGLSHFTVDETLDRGILDACRGKDTEWLAAIPPAQLNSGSSEIRNWIAVAGAAEGLEVAWQDYQPCYRTPAGTGCGMAFQVWE